MNSNLLIIFIKNPILGNAKYRIASEIGDIEALRLYKILLKKTKDICDQLKIPKAVFYSDFIDMYDIWDNTEYQKYVQEGVEIGERMKNCLKFSFDKGYRRVVLVGGDVWGLNPNTLMQAFQVIDQQDVVIGPALDGGYYLIGMTKLIEPVFRNKLWGTNKVLEQTVNDLASQNITYGTINSLPNIDNLKDLEYLNEYRYGKCL